jgi:hypothetical protein
MTSDRLRVDLRDPRLQDRVADNLNKFEITESGSLLFGINFGIVTDILTGPDGLLYVVSNTDGTVYRISRTPAPPGAFPPLTSQDALGDDTAREFLLAAALADLSGATSTEFPDFSDPTGGPTASVALPSAQRPDMVGSPVVGQEALEVNPRAARSRSDREADTAMAGDLLAAWTGMYTPQETSLLEEAGTQLGGPIQRGGPE